MNGSTGFCIILMVLLSGTCLVYSLFFCWGLVSFFFGPVFCWDFYDGCAVHDVPDGTDRLIVWFWLQYNSTIQYSMVVHCGIWCTACLSRASFFFPPQTDHDLDCIDHTDHDQDHVDDTDHHLDDMDHADHLHIM